MVSNFGISRLRVSNKLNKTRKREREATAHFAVRMVNSVDSLVTNFSVDLRKNCVTIIIAK